MEYPEGGEVHILGGTIGLLQLVDITAMEAEILKNMFFIKEIGVFIKILVFNSIAIQDIYKNHAYLRIDAIDLD